MSPILHWVQAGLTKKEGSEVLTSTTPVLAGWYPPGPPPGAAPHRYVFLLYEQPANFDSTKFAPAGKEIPIRSRVRYDLTKFEKEAGLGPILAANYYNSN